MKRTILLIALLIAGLLLAGWGAWRLTRNDGELVLEPARAILLRRDEKLLVETLARFRGLAARADQVTVYRVAQPLDEGFDKINAAAKVKVAGYPVLEQVSSTRDGIAPLAGILARRDSYFPPGDGWSCIFEPHHILQVAAGKEEMTVIICVSCGDVEFHENEKTLLAKSVFGDVNQQLARLLGALVRV